MIVCIAEKPSVAQDIARIIGANSRKDGYMEGNGYQVTWTFGHLCTLKEPHDYTPMWKSWSLGALPMIPQRFGIKLIEDTGIKKQFAVIERLMQAADGIINCGDAGQEGELIQRWVMQKAQAKCPVKRLWISSMTDEAIREGFQQLKDQSEYQEVNYEGYGPHGIAIFVETLTDNTTRTVGDVRSVFNKFNGNLGTQGSLAFLFDHKAVFTFKKTDGLDMDELILDLIDYGVEDEFDEDDEEGSITIYGDPSSFGAIQKHLEENGFEVTGAEFTRIPNDLKDVTPEQRETIDKMIEKLEDFDDVQTVYTNMKPE